jgi:hypothetical protein
MLHDRDTVVVNEPRSTLDLHGRGWMLPAGRDGVGWIHAAERASRAPPAYRFGVQLVAAEGPPRRGIGAGARAAGPGPPELGRESRGVLFVVAARLSQPGTTQSARPNHRHLPRGRAVQAVRGADDALPQARILIMEALGAEPISHGSAPRTQRMTP